MLHSYPPLVDVYEISRLGLLSLPKLAITEVPQDSLPPYFVESWSYSSALSVVDQCDQWMKPLNIDKAPPGFDAVKGELVELARHQVGRPFYTTAITGASLIA